MANLTRGIPLSKISPKFLHSNATSHTWPFSAVAELIDNAYDPDVSANELWIDKCVIHGRSCLVFQDDGTGMDFDHLLKMLSFGYCDKDAFENNANHLPIGHYGNGFKSGSMRLGKDAVVFTVCKTSASVGFLSQSYLEAIGADCVFVPMIEYRLPHQRFKSQESRNNLEAVMKHSPFRTEQELKAELRTLSKTRSGTGTKIVIYNLRRHKNGKLELDFESDSSDIRNPEAHEVDLTSVYHRTMQVETSEYMRSLRVYCSIMFLRPRMKIHIRGSKVKTQIISKSLSNTEMDVYKPTWLTKPLRITFGFSTKTPLKEDYGVMFYHRNRLIKPYEKLGFQKQPNDLGLGVVGVVQVDFLKPIHNKQDFEKDEKYNAIMSAIGLKLNDYWNEKKNGQTGSGLTKSTSSKLPDWLWVQCERCLKWRRLPDSARANPLPDQWFCHMNPDPTHNRCDIPEEPEDEDEAVKRPTYTKTFKKKQEEKKRQKQADIAAKEAELQAREAALLEAQRQQQLNEVSSSQNSRDIASLQRALLAARKREEDQKRLIVQIQNQKKQVADQRNCLVEVAQNLESAQTTPSELLEVASAMAPESNVSSTSNRQSSLKRRSSRDSDGSHRKVMNIETEQGDVFTIERADTDDDCDDADVESAMETSDPPVETSDAAVNATAVTTVEDPPSTVTPSSANPSGPSTTTSRHPTATSTPRLTPSKRKSRRAKKASEENVIDLTVDGDDEECSTVTTASETVDVKPSVEELNKQMEERQQAAVESSEDAGKGTGSLSASNKVNGMNAQMKEEEDSRLGHVQHKYKLLTQRFQNLQCNVHKLLSFIVPDVDLGPPDEIEHIVTEMIRVNCNQSLESS